MGDIKNLSEWSAAVRRRDGCCRRCSGTTALVAHHVKPKSIYPALKLVLENGETLCSNCHAEHHKLERGLQDADRCNARKTKLARLREENAALRKDVETMRRERAAELVDRNEMAILRARLAQYQADDERDSRS